MSGLRRPLAARAAVAGVITLAGWCAAGCGHHSAPAPAAQVLYLPAYGENHHCYWMWDPGEATTLLADHLCPAGWTPTRAPTSWRVRYYQYYDSPSYITHIVPAPARAAYRASESRFGAANTTAIKTASRTVVYRTASGGSVPASQAGVDRFGAGVAPKPAVGAGSARLGGARTVLRPNPAAPAGGRVLGGARGGRR